MPRQMFAAVLFPLLVALSACTVVGYPGGASRPISTARVAGAPAKSDPRTYAVLGRSYTTLAVSSGYEEVGIASWYGEDFHGRPTASGETYDMYGLTAAHRTLPLQTCVEVRRVDDDRSVVVRVNDRGPFDPQGQRIIDLSFSAAKAIGLVQRGTAQVEVRALESDSGC